MSTKTLILSFFTFLVTKIVPAYAFGGSGFDTRGGNMPVYAPPGSALALAIPAHDLTDLSHFPVKHSQFELNRAFQAVRDQRFLVSHRPSLGFLRRIPFLYPDDGCPVRATLIKDQLLAMGIQTARIFSFGTLSAKTEDALGGLVTWGFHTAPAALTHDGQILVFDPTLNSERPLLIEEWLQLQSAEPHKLKVSICARDVYREIDPCSKATPGYDTKRANEEVLSLLVLEWQRQEALGRDPYQVLGDAPPWETREHLSFD